MTARLAGKVAIVTDAASGFGSGPPLRGLTLLRDVSLHRIPTHTGASTP